MHELDTIYDYAWEQRLIVESCNFLDSPEFMRISVLPEVYRKSAADRLANWIAKHDFTGHESVINIRHPTHSRRQIWQDAVSYHNYLTNQACESKRLPDLVTFLTKIENHRGNRILDYIPEYEELFRSAGYKG